MAGITAAQATTALANWIAADVAVSSGQSYSIAGRSLARTDAKEIRENIDYWDNKCKELAEDSSGLIISQVAPSDV
jgi:hypothetical protein